MAGSYSKKVIEIEAKYAVSGAEEFERTLRGTSNVAKDIMSTNIDNGRRDAKIKNKQTKELSNLEKRTETYNKIGKKFNINQAQTDKLLSSSGFKMKKSGEITDKAGNIVEDYDSGLKNNLRTLGKFEMGYLGVMFSGMALNRTMSGLNATSREWLGIGELTSTMMGITMLSANMDLLEFGILPLFDALTTLPEGAQKAIGISAIALEGLGGVLMTGGQLMLGLGAFKSLYPLAFGLFAGIVMAILHFFLYKPINFHFPHSIFRCRFKAILLVCA